MPPVSSGTTPAKPSGTGSPRLVIAAIAASADPDRPVHDHRRLRVHRHDPPGQRPPGAARRVDRPRLGRHMPTVHGGAFGDKLLAARARGAPTRMTVVAMTHDFDPGPVGEPYASLVGDYPGSDVYPPDSFRVEWGPIFHRGRLDGSARLLVIGQDPAQSEAVVRRILVGEAGHRTQGLMAKLGFDRSYLLINTFLYSVYGQTGGEQHKDDPGSSATATVAGAIFAGNQIEAVLALGSARRTTPGRSGSGRRLGQKLLTARTARHSPDPARKRSGGNPAKLKQRSRRCSPTGTRRSRSSTHRSPTRTSPVRWFRTGRFEPGERIEIPEFDVPAGMPEWMRSPAAWAQRVGKTAAEKRATSRSRSRPACSDLGRVRRRPSVWRGRPRLRGTDAERGRRPTAGSAGHPCPAQGFATPRRGRTPGGTAPRTSSEARPTHPARLGYAHMGRVEGKIVIVTGRARVRARPRHARCGCRRVGDRRRRAGPG